MSKKGSKAKKSVPLVFDSPSPSSSSSSSSESDVREVSPSSYTTTTTTVPSATPQKLRPQVPSTNSPGRSDPSTSELARWEEAMSKLQDLDPCNSPALKDPSGLDASELEKWRRECEWWDKKVAHDQWVRQSYHAALVRERSATNWTEKPKKERKVNKDLPIEKYTMKLAKEKPFHHWYKVFEREMSRRDASEVETLNHLYFYVERECFSNWSEAMSPVQMNDLRTVIAQLDLHYPDKKTPVERRNAFRAYKQAQPDVLGYSTEKEKLYRLAYPAHNPGTSDDYRDSWLEGLYPPFIKTLWYESLQDGKIHALVRRVVELERAELASNSGYLRYYEKRNKTDTNPQKLVREVGKNSDKNVERDSKGKPLCHQFLQHKTCGYGSKCHFSHEEPKTADNNSRKNTTGDSGSNTGHLKA